VYFLSPFDIYVEIEVITNINFGQINQVVGKYTAFVNKVPRLI
jgi:hypothetical protein